MKFFIFNIRKSWPRYLFKNMEIFMLHIWKHECQYSQMKYGISIYPIGNRPSIFYINIKYLCITYEHLCSNFLRVSIEHYVYHMGNLGAYLPTCLLNYVYLRYLSNSVLILLHKIWNSVYFRYENHCDILLYEK